MTPIEIAVYCVIAAIPIGCFVMCFVVALGKRPGLRRRKQEPFQGIEKRCPSRKVCPNTTCRLPPSKCPTRKHDDL